MIVTSYLTKQSIILWSIPNKYQKSFDYLTAFRGHRSTINCLESSPLIGIITSGDEDGILIIWDINRKHIVRELPSIKESILTIKINHKTGDIMYSSNHNVYLSSVNGDLIAQVSSVNLITTLSFTNDESLLDSYVLFGCDDGSIHALQLVFNALTTSWTFVPHGLIQSTNCPITALVFEK